MPEVVKVEIFHSCDLTGSIKGMSNIVVAASVSIVEDPRNVLASEKATEETPKRFVEG
jgi:hypothetical protein